ncbi:NifB/NifX family molybdenum-iron cluster-binding protein [Tissierella sp.]|uniref:NifB/NifX family molybdenum-iron cluster-binding protein n=1 Tax=Tissierella sp. TaxID=41274 RepID=UPI0028A69E15|nr:NifB/NifX family molybdenum-iron cluster-binding protein [Tissierella sp.]
MKIVIPVNDNSIKTTVCMSFGRTPYFLIYDTDTKESIFIDNSAISSQGGAGIKAAQSVVDSGAEVLITPRCGEKAADVINAGRVKIYKTINDSIEDNIDAFINGQLSLLEEIHSGFHNHGGK